MEQTNFDETKKLIATINSENEKFKLDKETKAEIGKILEANLSQIEIIDPEIGLAPAVLKEYDLTVDILKQGNEKYLGLTVANFDDKANYEIVKKAHIEVKKLKTKVEERRKDIKDFYLNKGREIDAKANDIKAIIQNWESHLIEQRNVIDEEIKRRKEEAEKALQLQIESRVSAFAKCGAVLSFIDATNWTEETFKAQYEVLKINFETKQKIDAENEERRRVYEQEMEAKNRELEAREREIRRKEKEAFDIQVAENKRLKDELERKQAEEAKIKAEAEAKERERAFLLAKDARLEAISREFDTLEKAWAEIFRLTEVF